MPHVFPPPAARLGPRFEQALAYALAVHAAQERKGTGVPYAAHLLGVASLVLEHGGGEEEAVGALLHDAAEDHGGAARLADIAHRFGDRVAATVAACSDTLEEPKPSWRPRKEAWLARVRAERDPGALLVAAADKVHNARSLEIALHGEGGAVWRRFRTRSRDDQLWYYGACAEALRGAGNAAGAGSGLTSLLDELDRLVARLRAGP